LCHSPLPRIIKFVRPQSFELAPMGWQSYVLIMKDMFARDQQEVNRILAVCMMHNAYQETDDEHKVGETLVQVGMVTTKDNRQYILCGNGGGRSLTFKWFDDHNVTAFPYDREIAKKIQGDVQNYDLNDDKTWLYKK
jgi:hypothetical protein